MWLNLLKSEDPEIQLNGTMIIANIARRDDHCVKLVDAGAVELLAKLLLVQDARLQQMVTGALRNLAIPVVNKVKVAKGGVLPPLITCLSSTNAHVMFSAIGTIKALFGAPENRKTFVDLGGLESLIKIKDAIIIDASQNDEQEGPKKPKDMRVQYEAARTLAVLTEEPSAHSGIVSGEGLGLLKILLESNFELLQTEALKALQNLMTSEEDTEKMVSDKEEPLLGILIGALSRVKNEEIFLQTLALLSSLADQGEKYKSLLKEQGIVDILDAQSGSARQKEACQQLKSKLGPTS